MIGESTRLGKARSCKACGEVMADGDPDACMGMLDGVTSACCGHGWNSQAYVAYESGSVLHGADALRAMGLPTYRPPKGS